ncbi:MAG TPA: DUF1906 domain-containing protein [Solirubrobacteraceae bacterium]|nr:DUF1906 domain-containing protein [Solirubrobacteraceae bacterium]
MLFQPRNVAPSVCARALGAALLLTVLSLSLAAAAVAAPVTKTVTYRGYHLRVPRSWPVYNLSARPATCVRFNRHAVYVGRPGASEDCPAYAVGRTEAILIEPDGTATRLYGPHVARRIDRAAGVTVLGTWNRRPQVIQAALGFGSSSALIASAPAAPARLSQGARARTDAAAATATATATSAALPGQIYTGQGFDACYTPSTSQMSAWGSSPYRAIGVYIGGQNAACLNLTSSWVQQESAAGWHMIPIYVGLQAPGNGCGCASISPSSATSEGIAAANDAVTQAQADGFGAGNPLYYDMENYTRGTTSTSAVLNFLRGWTAQVHADGYLSGVYSNDSSGITDLVNQWGTGYPEPDEVWAANWNGSASTSDPYIPSSEWANHQRLHQYTGGHDETYGGKTLNIDNDYLDSATAAFGAGAAAASAAPANISAPTITGNPYVGQTLYEHHGAWSGAPSSYSYQWYRCAPTGAGCTAIGGATGQAYVLQSADLNETIRVAETAANTIGTGQPASSAQTAGVRPAPTSSYYLWTAYGNVYNALGAPFYGSAVNSGVSTISALAATRDGRGYWLANRAGGVFAYGDAVSSSGVRAPHPIIGMAAAPGGGFYLLTAYGNVFNLAGAPFHGSPRASGTSISTITGMAVTPDGRGYWLIDHAGQIFSYGDAAKLSRIRSRFWLQGLVAAPHGGVWAWTWHGNIYNAGGAPFLGSPYGSGYRTMSFRGLADTRTGNGYWMVQSGGTVLPFGNAEPLPAVRPKHPVIGIDG